MPGIALPLLGNPPAAAPFRSRFPRDVSIEITGRCNLRCRHCFNDSGPDSPHELPLERIEAVLDEVRAWGGRAVRVTGGEPTVHRRFRDVLAACAARGIAVGLNTNAVYPAELLEYLTTAPVELFLVGIDGLEANHDAVRGAGTFARAVAACRRLAAAGQRVMLAFHVGAGNHADVPGLVALAADLGADLKVAPLRPVGRAAREMPGALIAPADFHAVVRRVTALRREYPHVRLYTDFDLLDGGPPAGGCGADPERESCKAGRTMLNVRADGAINPCAFFDALGDGFAAGNVYRDSPTAVWERDETFAAFRAQRKADECQTCGHYRARCNGGCPAIAHATAGRVDALDPTCFAPLAAPERVPAPQVPVEPLAFARFPAPPRGDES